MKLLIRLLMCLVVWASPQGAAAEKMSVTLDRDLRNLVVGLPTISGGKLLKNDLDQHVVLISFFASWCPPCNIEFKHLNELQRAYQGKPLKIIAINYFEDLGGFKDDGERLERFIYRHKPTFHALKGNDAIAKKFEDVQRIPTVFIFDQSGRKALHFIHRYKSKKTNPSTEELQSVLTKLLGPPSRESHQGHPTKH